MSAPIHGFLEFYLVKVNSELKILDTSKSVSFNPVALIIDLIVLY